MKNLYVLNAQKTNFESKSNTQFFEIIQLKFMKTVFVFSIVLFLSGSLLSQTLTVLSPNGGETWMSGTTQTVSWQLDGDYADLYIEYSIDNGTYWNYLAYVSSYDSIIQLNITNFLYAADFAILRISMYDNQNIFDESDGYFTIHENPVYFYTPSTGQKIYGGVDVMLSWYTYTIDTFDVDYTIDGGTTWNSIATSHAEQSLNWTTPTTNSDNCMIRITDANDASVFGLSPTFSIVDQPTATVLTPNGGETWNYGSTATVSWSGTNLPYYLYIDYSNDGGITWDYLGYAYGNETGGTTDVYVPYDPTENALIRLIDPYYDIVLDDSDQAFTIYVPPVIMYNPYEGQEFYIKDVTWISWLSSEITEVDISLSTDGGTSWTTIAENVDADNGWYEWTIGGTPSSTCLIRVSDASDATKFGLSGLFSLLETPVITLNNPTGGEIWNTDSTYTISWTYENPNAYYVYVDYSTDSGLTWNYLGYVYHEDGQGSFEWKTPTIESNNYLMRVQDSYLNFVSDTSGFFAVKTFPNTPICIVSVDSATNQNIVIWEKPNDDLIDTFIIYKESDEMDVYESIGSIAYESSPIFIDTNSNPAVKSYRYKLGFSDSEGNIYPMGALHQTIHLAINKGVGDSWNLIWTDYLGIDVSTYNIYRSANGSNYEKIATISSSFQSFTDVNAPNGNAYYYIEVINENGCNLPARNISSSISNIATNNILGIENPETIIEARIYPNPAVNTFNVRLNGNDKTYKIQMVDLTGTVVLSKTVTNKHGDQPISLNAGDLESGLYFLKISFGNTSTTRKVIIKH